MNIAPIGNFLLWAALTATTVAAALHITASLLTKQRRSAIVSTYATYSYLVALFSVLGVCIVLSTLLLTHQFDIDYVYRYSSRELPPGYLFATFWAGQDGSFLLWAFWIAVLGQVLSVTTGQPVRSRLMAVYTPVLLFLLGILIVRNPFAFYVADPGLPLYPSDGIGLNPLLENPWMVVHPPTLFLGFAALTVPFAFALSALIWNDDPGWYRRAWPWVLFTFSTLGLGVMLGGYWAYETLGWGGFWGWDPVENGPLVPWLSTVALLHTFQVARARNSLAKSAAFLALFGFVAALYETFLTRTGILDKFSNHSFSTLGGAANAIVLYGLIVTTVVSIAMLLWRSRGTPGSVRVWDKATSREFGLALCVIILMISALLIAMGMSAPLITEGAVRLHLLANQSSVSPDYFNKANFPEAVLICLGMAVCPFVAWGHSTSKSSRPLWISLITASILTAIYATAATRIIHAPFRPEMLALLLSCLFALVANGWLLLGRFSHSNTISTSARTAGGALAHIGAALILTGVVGLVLLTHKDSVVLVQGQQVTPVGLPYKITYTGMSSDLFKPDNSLNFVVARSDGKHEFTVRMPFAVRNVEGTRQILARPAIAMLWWGDLYFAFEDGPEVFSPNQVNHFTIKRGETIRRQGYYISVLSFSLPPDVDAQVANGVVPEVYPLTARLGVTSPDGKSAVVSVLNTRYKDDPIAPAMPESALPCGGPAAAPESIAFEGYDPNSGESSFYVRDATLPLSTSFSIEVSTRPTIGLVWLGTLLIVAGGLLSMLRRTRENRLLPIDAPCNEEAAPIKHRGNRRNEKCERRKEAAARSAVGASRN